MIKTQNKKTIVSPYSKNEYQRNAMIYRHLANPNRLEILNLLKIHRLTVTEIVEIMKSRKAYISQHLSVLRKLKLVVVDRIGKNAYYKIADPKITETCQVLHKLWSQGVLVEPIK